MLNSQCCNKILEATVSFDSSVIEVLVLNVYTLVCLIINWILFVQKQSAISYGGEIVSKNEKQMR